MDPEAAALYLHIHTETLRRLTDCGLIECVNIGSGKRKHYRYTQTGLDNYICKEAADTAQALRTEHTETVRHTTTVQNNVAEIAASILRRKGIY